MKILIFLVHVVLIIFSVHVRAEGFDVRCFTHIKNSGEKLNLKLSTMFLSSDRLEIGYVRYENSDEAILLYFSGETERLFEEGRPVEVTTKWKEIVNGMPAGEYSVVSQGAVVYGLKYISVSGRVFGFNYNSKATGTGRGECNWRGDH